MVPALSIFSVGTLGCALAPTFPALVVFRFIVGLGAACAVSIVGGVYADIYDDPVSRGRAVAAFMAVSVASETLALSTSEITRVADL